MSSGSESDEDYVPGQPEQVSEEESADEETDKQYETELEKKAEKRKSQTKNKGSKKRKTKEPSPEIEETAEPDKPLDPEEEKKRADDLWAQFLDGTDTKPKKSVAQNGAMTSQVTETKPVVDKTKPQDTSKCKNKDDNESRERRIFEFAGETIVVENNVIKEKLKSGESSAAVPKAEVPSRGRGGLSSLIGQLNKKNKLSTLEKTKLDWNTYKKVEGVEEEVQSHNKGKQGYLERQDFLERADLRQFELEREARLAKRSNR